MIRTAHFQSAAPAPAAASGAPRIVPNRRSLDNRFPVLGFTVDAAGKRYYEVLLSTDPVLFAPGQEAMRTSENFFSSRQHTGLLETEGTSVYLVPSAVMLRFGDARPRPTAIYYTLIAYDDAAGGNPAYANPPDRPPQQYPSVVLSGDFSGRTLAKGLGVSLEKLQQVAVRRRGRSGASGYVQSAGAVDAVSDAAAGEDGYQLEAAPPAATAGAGSGNGTGNANGHSDGIGPTTHPSAVDAGIDAAAGEDAVDYFRRVGGAPPADNAPADETASFGPQTWASETSGFAAAGRFAGRSQETVFPRGASEPLPLDEAYGAVDDDEDDWEYQDGYEQSGFDDDHGLEEAASRNAVTDEDDVADADCREGQSPRGMAQPSGYSDEADEFQLEPDHEGPDEFPDYGMLEAPVVQPGGGNGSAAMPSPDASLGALTIDDRLGVLANVGRNVSGAEGYRAVSFDQQRGLIFGIVGFSQASGDLGRLLTMMQHRDAALLQHIFGGDTNELLRITNAADRHERLQPVQGRGLGDPAWQRRFVEAGGQGPFQAAQNELASKLFIDPMLPFVAALEIHSERGLTMAVEIAARIGVPRAQTWILDAVRALATPAEQRQALDSLGFTAVTDFQRAQGLEADGLWGPQTRATAVAALRQLGDAAPVPIPRSAGEVLDTIVRQAQIEESPAAAALQTWRHAMELDDRFYQIS
jgi:hypothetical protein